MFLVCKRTTECTIDRINGNMRLVIKIKKKEEEKKHFSIFSFYVHDPVACILMAVQLLHHMGLN